MQAWHNNCINTYGDKSVLPELDMILQELRFYEKLIHKQQGWTMKCERCKCDTYVIHVNSKHEKVCIECYRKGEKESGMSPTGIKGNEETF